MNKPLLHFAHANGFPAKVYSRLFANLESHFRVIHVDMLALNPVFPVGDGWHSQGDEIINFLESTADHPVIGVGHSFGASSTFIAAVKRPDLFSSLILLDPVVMNGLRGYVTKLLKKLRLVDRITPARHSANRRRQWPDLESAEDYFKSKALFKGFHKDCLQDFLKYGLKKTGNRYELMFSVENEMAIYRGAPTHFDKLKNKLQNMPGVIIKADKTNVAYDDIVDRLARQHNFDRETIEGYHMFPLEQPDLTARLILKYGRQYS